MKVTKKKRLWENYSPKLIDKLYNKYKNEAISWDDLHCIEEEVKMNYSDDISKELVEKLADRIESERTHLLESECGEKDVVAEDLINEKDNYCLGEYKKYAEVNGSVTEGFNEDNLDEWALEKVSAENNYDYDDLKNLLLGGK